MARDLNPKCKRCRRAGEKLFLKGDRCSTPKCAFTRRPFAPGQKSQRRRGNLSEYGRQLAEKQKVKRTYGILEKQFRNYVLKAVAAKGDSRENLMIAIERRLDNVLHRLGVSHSKKGARQIVNHGLVKVNGRRVDIASFRVKKQDVIDFKDRTLKSPLFANIKATAKKQQLPSWLIWDAEKMQAKVVSLPGKEDLGDLSALGVVIEFYSR